LSTPTLNYGLNEPARQVDFKPRKQPDPDSPIAFPLPAEFPLGPALTKAKELLEEWQLRAAYTAELVANLDRRLAEVAAKEDEIRRDHERAAEEGDTSLARVKRLHEECVAFGAEKRALLDPRLSEARSVALQAAEAFHSHTDLHARELIAELEDEAGRVRTQFVDEQARVTERLAAIQAEHGQLCAAASCFSAGVRAFAGYRVPFDEPTELPLPQLPH
jgi:hypothetical protein